MGGWVYIMTNKPNGILYTGVTSDLSRRVWEHKEGLFPGFTKRYKLNQLVWFTFFEDIRQAIQHEKNMKHWPRAWKVQAIHGMNVYWSDLYDTLG
jgi:putative endonuclease